MRIDSSVRIASVPILEVRKLLQRVRELEWSIGYAAELLHISPFDASVLIEELLNQGFISKSSAPQDSPPSNSGILCRTTIRGNALTMASAGKPILRKTADRLLGQFLDRVRQVNGDPKFVYRVTTVRVFGSYLTSALTLGDIDLDIAPESKRASANERHNAMQARINDAVTNGRAFRNIVDYYSWLMNEVLLYLKHRSAAISLHMYDPIVEETEYRVIFMEEG